jgi:4a-hydroxytetrahydrobiopterin dehydratase
MRMLTSSELENIEVTLPGWKLERLKLHKDFKFKDFKEAFAFMTCVATYAEELKHHPEWSNSYDKVSIDLFTHDVGGISDLDVELAKKIGL